MVFSMAKRNRKKQRQRGKRSTGTTGQTPPVVVHLKEFEITWDPIPMANFGVPPEVVAQMDELHETVMSGDAASVVTTLERYWEQYPQAPVFGNWLSVAYQRIDRIEDTMRVTREIFECHSDYIFARVNLAEEALRYFDLAEAERFLGAEMFLPALFPERKLFHISEFLSFCRVAGQYELLNGNLDGAKKNLKMMKDLEPDHPSTCHLRDKLEGDAADREVLLATVRKLMKHPPSRRKPKPRRKDGAQQLELAL